MVDWEGLEQNLDQDLSSLLSPAPTSPIHSLPADLSSYLDLECQYDTASDYLSDHPQIQQENFDFDFNVLGDGVDLVYPHSFLCLCHRRRLSISWEPSFGE